MTERLHRVHELLQAGNVPCKLSRQAGLGTVVFAGTPNAGPWEVLLFEAGGELWIHHDGEALMLPADTTDVMAADAVKLRVVQAWADQGDPEAKLVLAKLKVSAPQFFAPERRRPTYHEPAASGMTMQLFDPMAMAANMFDMFTADIFDIFNNLSRDFFTPRAPVTTTFILPFPWGTFQSTYTRR